MKQLIDRLNRIDHLIRHRQTGTPGELAVKLGVGERSVYLYIKLMKEFGAPIRFSRGKQSYYYMDSVGQFIIGFREIA